MQDKKIFDEASILEATTTELNGHTVQASKIYDDYEELEPMVDLHVDGRLYAELMPGDHIPIGGGMWEVVSIQRARNKVKQGVIVLRRG